MSEFDLFMNKNTDWTAGRFVQLFYLVFVVLCWALITLSGFFTFADSWTVINIVHGAVCTKKLYMRLPIFSLDNVVYVSR